MGTNSRDQTTSADKLLAGGGPVARRALPIGLIGAAAILPIGLLALGRAAVARGLAALRGAGGRFCAISGAARRRISRHRAGRDHQATKGGQEQNLLHHGINLPERIGRP